MEIRDHRKPGWLWADRKIIKRDGAELGPHGIAVYIALCAYADTEQKAWPAHASLSEITGMSRRHVVRSLKKLQAMGWVVWEQRRTKEGGLGSNIYTLLATPERGGSDRESQGVVTGSHKGSDRESHKREPYNESHIRDTILSPSKKPRPSKPWKVFTLWCEEHNYDPIKQTKTVTGKECKYAKELLEAGWTLDQIGECLHDMKQEPFWVNKRLSLGSVAKGISEWHKQRTSGRTFRA